MKTADALDPAETLQWMRDSFFVHLDLGHLVWKNPSKHHPRLLLKAAGSERVGHNGKRYVYIKKGRRAIKRSWLIFLWVKGRWPDHEVDHRDGNSLNDSKKNLREATDDQNAQNHKTRKKPSSLPMGVRALPSGRFQSRIAVNGKKIAIGSFVTAESAHSAYLAKRKELFGEFA